MKRRFDSELDYVDYGYFYDALAGYGSYFYDNAGDYITPNQFIQAKDRYTKQSHELRITSPADRPLRVVAGAFYQRQKHNIRQDYIIPGLADNLPVDGTESDIWLTQQLRVDRDYALFGEVSFDITPQFTITGGGRLYRYNNSLLGFFGFNSTLDDGEGYSSNPDFLCFRPSEVDGAPCTNLDRKTKDSGFVHRLNATYKPNDDLLLYGTWSRGFRPGGINRRGTLPPYKPDYITNFEAGAKYSLGRGSHLNVAVYQEDWDDIQISALGANGLTEIRNAGRARIRGLEADLLLRPVTGMTWSTGLSFNDAKMREDFCFAPAAENCAPNGGSGDNGVPVDFQAHKGDRLPLTARWKGSSSLRYEWNLTPDVQAHAQGVVTYEGNRRRDLRPGINDIYGNMRAYSMVDLSTGVARGLWNADLYVKNLFDTRGALSKNLQCNELKCGDPADETAIGGKVYTVYTQPTTIGLRIGRKF
jgi:outer membrane receptor protein involved in Fe transport